MGIADDGPDSLAQLFSERGIAPCGSTAWWKERGNHTCVTNRMDWASSTFTNAAGGHLERER